MVIFYSYSGNTKALAQELAAKEHADLAEIKDARRPGVARAYTAGCFAALRGKGWPTQPLQADLGRYGRLALLSPVWAGNAPPAVNAFLEKLPEGKAVAVKMVSSSGGSRCRARLEAAIKAKGCRMDGFEDVKAPAKSSK